MYILCLCINLWQNWWIEFAWTKFTQMFWMAIKSTYPLSNYWPIDSVRSWTFHRITEGCEMCKLYPGNNYYTNNSQNKPFWAQSPVYFCCNLETEIMILFFLEVQLGMVHRSVDVRERHRPQTIVMVSFHKNGHRDWISIMFLFLKEIREGTTLRSKNKAKKYAIKQCYKSCKWSLKS